ncbi:MAG: flagellar basal body-associated FliL family protein [Proteobacteria bacterium]|nr:flagellar basal body-associated FliL family protein [Pseudomonadota bacterium]
MSDDQDDDAPEEAKEEGAGEEEDTEAGDEEAGEEKAEEDSGEGKKGGKKKLIIIAAAGLVVILGGGGAYFAGLFDSLLGAKGPTLIAVIDLGEPVLHEFPQIKADLKTGRCRSALLRTTFVIQMRDKDLKRVQAMELRITDAVRSYLRDRERSELVGKKGEERLRFDTTKIINNLIAPSRIEAIYFKEFVLQ